MEKMRKYLNNYIMARKRDKFRSKRFHALTTRGRHVCLRCHALVHGLTCNGLVIGVVVSVWRLARNSEETGIYTDKPRIKPEVPFCWHAGSGA
ncbi:hypothetical protein AKJ16_DCAP25294 [Drosera capensis]